MRWRLEQARDVTLDSPPCDGGYETSGESAKDLSVLISATSDAPGSQFLAGELNAWRTQIETFGFHLARLDIRQNAKIYAEVTNEVFRVTGICPEPESLDEQQRCSVLMSSLERAVEMNAEALSPQSREALALFQTIHRAWNLYSPSALGAHVISMTASASDVFTVLWLLRLTSPAGSAAEIPIAPLRSSAATHFVAG